MSIGKKLAISYTRSKFRILSSVSPSKAAEKAFQLFCTPQYRNSKQPSQVFESAENLEFKLGNDIVRGYRFNHPASKKILICHGFESTIINFEKYIQPLVKQGFEIMTFDAPAHGKSSGKRINILMYQEMIKLINHQFGPVKYFMGHSLGGLALTLYLESVPHDETFKLVLIAPAASTKRAIDNFFKFLRLNNAVRTEFDQLIYSLANRKPEWYSVERAADNIKAEVLFLQDKHDDMTPVEDVYPIMKKNLPNFRFIISEGLGHRRIYRDNGSFQSIINFFSGAKN